MFGVSVPEIEFRLKISYGDRALPVDGIKG
jgi:hypothetical protein